MDRAKPTHVCGIAALDVARVSGRGFKPQKIVRGISKALFYEIPCDPGSRHPKFVLERWTNRGNTRDNAVLIAPGADRVRLKTGTSRDEGSLSAKFGG